MTSLKIIMFTTFYPPYSFGGDAIGVQRLAHALAARGHQITVVHDIDAYLSLGGPQVKSGATDDGKVRRIGLQSKSSVISNFLTHQTGHPIVHGKRIQTILDEGNFDIIWHNNTSLVGGPGLLSYGNALKVYEAHEHWLVCPTHVLWRNNKERCDKKQCWTCSLAYKRPPQIWRSTGLLERQLDLIDVIIAKSDFSRNKHAEFGLKNEMTTIPYFLPPIETVETSGQIPPHDRPYFLFVGRLEKIKGVQDILPAFDNYKDADLLILGDGDYSDELKSQAADNPRIKFLGRRTPDQLEAYYRGALGLIVPSICYETFGLILIESFRLGTPVIARNLGPFPEIVNASGGGALFESEDELLSAMKTLQNDPSQRQKQSEAALLAFDAHWSEEAVLPRYGEALAKAARRAGRVELAVALEAGVLEQGVITAS